MTEREQDGRSPQKDPKEGLRRYRVERACVGGQCTVVKAHDETEAENIAMSADFTGEWMDTWEDDEDYEATPVAALSPDEQEKLSGWAE